MLFTQNCIHDALTAKVTTFYIICIIIYENSINCNLYRQSLPLANITYITILLKEQTLYVRKNIRM